MGQTYVINARQLSWLVASLLGSSVIGIQNVLVRIAKVDAWMSYLLPTIHIFFTAFVFYKLAERFPNEHIYEINKKLVGKWLGTLLNIILLVHFFLVLVRLIRTLGKFIGTILLPNTPEEIIVIMIGFVMIYYGRMSLEIVARVNDIFFPLFFLLLISMPLLLANEMERNLAQPILASLPLSFIKANILQYGWSSDIWAVGAFLHMMAYPKQMKAAIRQGGVIGMILLTICFYVQLAVFGPNISANFIYPSYSLVQQIHITDFLDRVDIVILSVWFPILICKIVIIYTAFLYGISSLVGQRHYQQLNIPVGLVLVMTAIMSFKSMMELISYGNYAPAAFSLAFQPLLFIVVLVMARKHPIAAHYKQPNAADERKKAPHNSWIYRIFDQIGYTGWTQASNLLLFGCLLLIAIGFILGSKIAYVGNLCGAGYMGCLLLILFTTEKELGASFTQK